MSFVFLQWARSDGSGLKTVRLDELEGPVLIGRREGATVLLDDDVTVSRGHATVRFVEGVWVIEDIGSRAGTFLIRAGGLRRIAGAQRLLHGDLIRVGRTMLKFQCPPLPGEVPTVRAGDPPKLPSAREMEVLQALCAYELSGLGGVPGDEELAARLGIAVNTVKSHVQNLFRKLDIVAPDRQKRARLVRRAIDEGWVSRADECVEV